MKKIFFIILLTIFLFLSACAGERENVVMFSEDTLISPTSDIILEYNVKEDSQNNNKYKDSNYELPSDFWEIRSDAYPVATQIYKFLKEELALNNYVCAGILGNLMAETGGQTLNIEWDIGTDYYGICQWSLYYNPEIEGANLEEQLEYLKSNIKSEFQTFGYLYKENFDYDDFVELKNVEAAALAFAKCYERCHHDYYIIRQENAEVAYEFIVLGPN